MSAREAYLYDPDGTVTPVLDPGPEGFDLEGLYATVETDIVEIIPLAGDHEGLIMVIDEEGKLRENPQVNVAATLLLMEAGGIEGDVIVGKALVCPSDMVR